MRVRTMLAAAMALAVVSCSVAVAADTTNTVVIPYGDWLAQIATVGVSVAGAAIAWACRLLPARYVSLIQMTHADQILTMAVTYALNAVAGAAPGKSLTVNVGNAVIQQAVTYVITNGPKWLIAWLGGEAGITQKIIARLTLDESVSVQTVANSAVLVPAA